jgi:hypothetical protein
MPIEKDLGSLNKVQLLNLVAALYGIYSDIDDIIVRHVEASAKNDLDSSAEQALFDVVEQQIAVLKRENEFIDYRGAYNFSCRLQSLLVDIDTLMREPNPVQAFVLVEAFIDCSNHVMDRCDDSSGDIGEVFRDAIGIWLDIAKQLRANCLEESLQETGQASAHGKTDWLEKVVWYFDNNDYGCFDNVISASAGLLTHDELEQLAWRFENDIKKALSKAKSESSERWHYNAAASHASIGLRSVAQALEKMALFETATLLSSPSPNELQMAEFVKFALIIDDFERAQYWLQQPGWSEERGIHKRLTTELLRHQGDIAQIKENFRQYFEAAPSFHNLVCYWELADKQERKVLAQTVAQIAPVAPDIDNAINMLLAIDNILLAADVLVLRAQEMACLPYGIVTEWVETFDKNLHTLAAIVCYRTLLSDILDRGRSQAYHYAADYFCALLRLDKSPVNYGGLGSAQEYITQLQGKHWRKRSFWEKAGYPNKGLLRHS